MNCYLTEVFQSKVEEEKRDRIKQSHVEHFNPKTILIAELYRSFNPVTSEWIDGVLFQSNRHCSFTEPNELKWIIVDGSIDSLWI